MTGYSGTELPWTGGKPWRILDECKAATHNMLNVGRGRAHLRNGIHKTTRRIEPCICPGAKAAIKADNEGRRKRTQRERVDPRLAQGAGPRRTSGGNGAWVPPKVRMPNFEDAECRSPLGRRIMDAVISTSGGSNTKAVKQAKELCERCPIRETLCGPYVTAAEQPTGSWYGVWAGMTQAERRAAQGLTR